MTANLSSARPGRSILALESTNFFLADVQTGLGPFLAAYLGAAHWKPSRIGIALSLGGIVGVILQTPAGWLVDNVRRKRAILAVATGVLVCGALLLAWSVRPVAIYSAQFLIGGAGPFLGPTLAAITMGLVGRRLFDLQFGKNQSFNSAGNVFSALLAGAVSHVFGNRAIFLAAALLTLPTVLSIAAIRPEEIDYEGSRGGLASEPEGRTESILKALLGDRVLLAFFGCAFCFHFANAAMLPQLGEMLARGSEKSSAPLMAACIVVTQVVIALSAAPIGRLANIRGRKPLLLLGFGVLPVRAMLYTLTLNPIALISIQVLDGLANAIFVVVSVLLVADRTCGTGRFNLVQGGLATAAGIGAVVSTTFGGKLIEDFSFRISFLGLGAVGLAAFLALWFFVPETHNANAVKNPGEGSRA